MSALLPTTDINFKTCPLRNVISRFSDKWSLLVLFHLHQDPAGILRFNELRRHMPDCSHKMLSQTLKHLEADHFVCRQIYAEVPPRVEYSLTPVGTSLMPVLDGLIDWAHTHFHEVVSR